MIAVVLSKARIACLNVSLINLPCFQEQHRPYVGIL
jgi:hypothetical protein